MDASKLVTYMEGLWLLLLVGFYLTFDPVLQEEDFVLHNGNVPLCQPSDDNPLGTLSGAEDRCASWAAPQEGRPDAGGQSACPPGWKLDKATSSALHCRLRFRKAFLQVIFTCEAALPASDA